MTTSKRSLVNYLLVFGVTCLIVAVIFYYKTQYFLKNSLEVKGEIINIYTDINIDMHSNATFYFHPDVRFETKDREEVVFRSSSSLESDYYKPGQIVDVLYLPEDPENAKLKANSNSLWLFPKILGFIGLLDLIIALEVYLFLRRKEKLKLWLQQFGRRLKTKFVSLEKGYAGKSTLPISYKIITQWEENGEIYKFKSERFKFDPTSELKENHEIVVWVNPQNREEYYMDTSFL